MPCSMSPEQVTPLTTAWVDASLLSDVQESSGGSAGGPQPIAATCPDPNDCESVFLRAALIYFSFQSFRTQDANLFAD